MQITDEDEIQIRDICSAWEPEDIANLAIILNLSEHEGSIDDIGKKIKWLYHSKTRAQGKVAAKGIWAKLTGETVDLSIEDQFPMPAYKALIRGLLEKMDVDYGDDGLVEQEYFLCDAVIAEALLKMTPQQRRRAFTEKMELDKLDENLASHENTITQAAKGLGGFSMLNAAGFSLYTSSTMALSFATGMAGITLPFTVYTGMTSFISVIIGPIGWAVFGSWIAWKGTSSEWDKLRAALLYIITVSNRERSNPRPSL